ncbi:MAG TPA: hypothetical protein VMH27_20850 [Puia sp.]|nr:hypothetical protein [Puia sp.]
MKPSLAIDSMRFPPIVPVQHVIKITVEREVYAIDLDRHTGAKSSVQLRFRGSVEQNFKQMGFRFVRPDTLLGKPCLIWEKPHAFRLWLWKGFYVVKKQMIDAFPGGMRIEEYPTMIDESYTIKPDEFKIPDNIKFP